MLRACRSYSPEKAFRAERQQEVCEQAAVLWLRAETHLPAAGSCMLQLKRTQCMEHACHPSVAGFNGYAEGLQAQLANL